MNEKILEFIEPSEYILDKDTSSLGYFKIKKIRGGVLPAVITIDGFLNENKDDIEEWEVAINKKYNNNVWYHLYWESQTIKKMINNTVISSIPWFIAKRSLISTTNPILGVVISLRPILSTFGLVRTWRNAVKNSEKSGELLSEIMTKTDIDSYVLIGHSLGCRVIYNCLKNLNKNKIVYEVHLLGGAIDSNKDNWKSVEFTIENRIYNYLSNNDMVLNTLFKLGTGELNPIGRDYIKTSKSINVNVGSYVKGHTLYKKEFINFIQ